MLIKISKSLGQLKLNVYTCIEKDLSTILSEDGKHRLEKFNEDWTKSGAYWDSNIKLIGVKPVVSM